MTKVLKILGAMAEIYGRHMSTEAVELFASDLAGYPERLLLDALARCRRELRTFPTTAEVIARLDDGRPGPDEAWAMVPRDESQTVVWTEETAQAYGSVQHLLDEDKYAARTGFREVYIGRVTEARMRREPVRWLVSLGHDVSGREPVLRQAEASGKLTASQVATMLPHAEPAKKPALLPGGGEMNTLDPLAMIAKIKALR